MNDVHTGALKCGMHLVKVFHGEADVRARFLTSLGRIDVEQQEVLRPLGPRSPSGVYVAGAAILVDLGLAKWQSKEVPVKAKGPINVAYS
jgi:hypothetical protein